MQTKWVVGVVGVMVSLALIAGGVFVSSAVSGDYGLTEMKVQNLSCGSCVAKITQALSGQEGVGKVDVNVTTGRAKIEFDASKIDATQIAAVITEAGYPASPDTQLTAEEYSQLVANSDQLAASYVARIGERLISRQEFDALVAARRPPGQTSELDFQLRPSVWQQMLQREVLIVDATNNEVIVQDGEVALEIKKIREKFPDLDAYVAAEFGTFEAFAARVKTDMIIDRNIERNVIKDETDKVKQRALVNDWFAKVMSATPVEIYDADLKAVGAGGCGLGGGSCCSKPQG